MIDWFKNLFSCITKKPAVEGAGPPPRRYTVEEKGKAKVEYDSTEDAFDPCMWSRRLDEHAYGEFSIAAAQAMNQMEDQSQVEAGRNATAVGVYDGHIGPEASQYLCEHLFDNILQLALRDMSITEGVLKNAINNTDVGFLSRVEAARGEPMIRATGSCCLVGIIWDERLFVANLGDSRAVVGCLRFRNRIRAEQLTKEHTVYNKKIRKELRASHPYDPDIVVKRDGFYSIKNTIKVSRAIGAAYLKDPRFEIRTMEEFALDVPIQVGRPVVSAVPQIVKRVIRQTDKFVIFATDGLWENLSNQEAVEIVHNNPREGIARRLVRAALTVAMHRKGRGLEYSLLKNIEKGPTRRSIHDDTSVVVLFIDHSKMKEFNSTPGYSIRAFSEATPLSKFALEPEPVQLN